MRLVVAIFTLAGILSACGSDRADIEAAKAELEANLPILKDIEYRNLEAFPGHVVCGQYSVYDSHVTPKEAFKRFLTVRGKLVHMVGGVLYRAPTTLDWDIFCSNDSAAALLAKTGVGLFDDKNDALAKIAADFSALGEAINAYNLENHKFPYAKQGLRALVTPTEVAPRPRRFPAGGYIVSIPLDPWGAPYIYTEEQWGRVQGSFELSTLGADGVTGGSGENADVNTAHFAYLSHIAGVLESR